jgi:hypothetical protein
MALRAIRASFGALPICHQEEGIPAFVAIFQNQGKRSASGP